MSRIWPRSLMGRVLLALAAALLLAQGLSAVLVQRAQDDRRQEAMIHTLAFRLLAAIRAPGVADGGMGMRPWSRPETAAGFAPRAGDEPDPAAQGELARILGDQDIAFAQLIVVRRPFDPASALPRPHRHMHSDHQLVAAIERQGGGPWLIVPVPVQPRDPRLLLTLILQTLLIYALLVGAMALILQHITRPLALLARRLDTFAETRSAEGRLAVQGPDDIRQLIGAHNAMEARIIALLDEKNVMLGAIGHDLKTPLAALRVRIESVEDGVERGRMARTIEDITRSLDDILSLARVGQPTDPREPTELSALLASVVEDYEDMGENVTLAPAPRIVLNARATWLRRAIRNLVGNALRYGGAAAVALVRDDTGWAVVTIDDNGPGIPQGDIARMMEPFTRGDPSRNSETGGAGLGLTLARAIAEQHGGTLTLTNRRDIAGSVLGLTARLRLRI